MNEVRTDKERVGDPGGHGGSVVLGVQFLQHDLRQDENGADDTVCATTHVRHSHQVVLIYVKS